MPAAASTFATTSSVRGEIARAKVTDEQSRVDNVIDAILADMKKAQQ